MPLDEDIVPHAIVSETTPNPMNSSQREKLVMRIDEHFNMLSIARRDFIGFKPTQWVYAFEENQNQL